METQTLKIHVPEGFMVDSFDHNTGEIKFKEKPKNVFERIKTFEDVLTDNGISLEEFDKECFAMEYDEAAFKFLKLLAKSLNEGWEPDWNDEDQYKYYPWFYMGGSSGFRFVGCDSWASSSLVGSRLCFKSRELAEYAGQQFTDQYKRFMLNTLK